MEPHLNNYFLVYFPIVGDSITQLMRHSLHRCNYWRSERSECSHSQVIKIEICDIYIYIYRYKNVKFDH